MILVAATLYGLGKTFFWPTMLGVVAERFPKGGALTLNIIAGVGMLGVGVVGALFLGNIQDKEIDKSLKDNHTEIHTKVVGPEKTSIFGNYSSLDKLKVATASAEDQKIIKETGEVAKKSALKTVAIFPVIMLICYLLLFLYFKLIHGGYRAETLDGHAHPHPH